MKELDFGQKIAIIAKENFKTQTNMAKELGLKQSTISDWISGRIKPSFEVLKTLCEKAEISLDWLVLGKTFDKETIDLNLFDEVFILAYMYANESNLEVAGRYFIGCYDYVLEQIEINKKLNITEPLEVMFEKCKPKIQAFRAQPPKFTFNNSDIDK